MKFFEKYSLNNNKVAIVTIISKNYGNRLQNYALQESLRKLGFEAYTIPYRVELKTLVKEKIKLLLISLNVYFRNRWVWEDFNRKYIRWEKPNSDTNYQKERYDHFIAGSDQIWNPLFWINSEREFLTSFDENKRIAYAASIGIDQLPKEYLDRYQVYLNEIPHISVREDKAVDIIYHLTGRRVPVVIDPTMLLTQNEWIAMISTCKIKAPQRYILKYFLGTGTADYDKHIRESAKKEGLEIIDLLDEKGNAKRKIGPKEFVYYIANSERTYVDSFHGTVFSILFSKPFVVFERPYEEGAGLMTSRLDTLLSTFQLEGRMVKDLKQLERIEDNCDFSKVEGILNTKRNEALDFLMKALCMERRG
jgi:hypothetical protein